MKRLKGQKRKHSIQIKVFIIAKMRTKIMMNPI